MLITLAFWGLILFDLWLIKDQLISDAKTHPDDTANKPFDPAIEQQKAGIQEQARLNARANHNDAFNRAVAEEVGRQLRAILPAAAAGASAQPAVSGVSTPNPMEGTVGGEGL